MELAGGTVIQEPTQSGPLSIATVASDRMGGQAVHRRSEIVPKSGHRCNLSGPGGRQLPGSDGEGHCGSGARCAWTDCKGSRTPRQRFCGLFMLEWKEIVMRDFTLISLRSKEEG
jgi:hypothetical protein